MYRHGGSWELRTNAQSRRFTKHGAHHEPCALHLCGEGCQAVSLRRWDSGRRRAHTLISARNEAAGGNDWTQFARSRFGKTCGVKRSTTEPAGAERRRRGGLRELTSRAASQSTCGCHVVERNFQLSIQNARSGRSDSLQEAKSILWSAFLPNWLVHEHETAVGFHQRAPTDWNFRFAK